MPPVAPTTLLWVRHHAQTGSRTSRKYFNWSMAQHRRRSIMWVMATPSLVPPAESSEEGKAVQHDQSNYGAAGSRAMSAQDERTWSVLSSLSMFLTLVSGFL